MLRSCSYCGGIHKRNYTCSAKPTKFKKGTAADKFRNTSAWKRKRVEIKERDKYLCQVCLRNLHNTQQQYNMHNLEVHHIVPIVKDYSKRLDNDNLISLCRYHHELAECGDILVSELKSFISPPL